METLDQLIAKIEADLPYGAGWVLRTNEMEGVKGKYFGSITGVQHPTPHERFSFITGGNSPYAALEGAWKKFQERKV